MCILVKIAMRSIATSKKAVPVPAKVKTDVFLLLTGSEDTSTALTIDTIITFLDSFIESTATMHSLPHIIAGCRSLITVSGLAVPLVDSSSATAEKITTLVMSVVPPQGTNNWSALCRGVTVDAVNAAVKVEEPD